MENKFDVRSLISSGIVFRFVPLGIIFFVGAVVDLDGRVVFFPVIAVMVLEKVGDQNL